MNINIRNKDDNALLRTVSCSTFGDDTDVCGLGTSDDYALVSFTVNSCKFKLRLQTWTIEWSSPGLAITIIFCFSNPHQDKFILIPALNENMSHQRRKLMPIGSCHCILSRNWWNNNCQTHTLCIPWSEGILQETKGVHTVVKLFHQIFAGLQVVVHRIIFFTIGDIPFTKVTTVTSY